MDHPDKWTTMNTQDTGADKPSNTSSSPEYFTPLQQ